MPRFVVVRGYFTWVQGEVQALCGDFFVSFWRGSALAVHFLG